MADALKSFLTGMINGTSGYGVSTQAPARSANTVSVAPTVDPVERMTSVLHVEFERILRAQNSYVDSISAKGLETIPVDPLGDPNVAIRALDRNIHLVDEKVKSYSRMLKTNVSLMEYNKELLEKTTQTLEDMRRSSAEQRIEDLENRLEAEQRRSNQRDTDAEQLNISKMVDAEIRRRFGAGAPGGGEGGGSNPFVNGLEAYAGIKVGQAGLKALGRLGGVAAEDAVGAAAPEAAGFGAWMLALGGTAAAAWLAMTTPAGKGEDALVHKLGLGGGTSWASIQSWKNANTKHMFPETWARSFPGNWARNFPSNWTRLHNITNPATAHGPTWQSGQYAGIPFLTMPPGMVQSTHPSTWGWQHPSSVKYPPAPGFTSLPPFMSAPDWWGKINGQGPGPSSLDLTRMLGHATATGSSGSSAGAFGSTSLQASIGALTSTGGIVAGTSSDGSTVIVHPTLGIVRLSGGTGTSSAMGSASLSPKSGNLNASGIASTSLGIDSTASLLIRAGVMAVMGTSGAGSGAAGDANVVTAGIIAAVGSMRSGTGSGALSVPMGSILAGGALGLGFGSGSGSAALKLMGHIDALGSVTSGKNVASGSSLLTQKPDDQLSSPEVRQRMIVVLSQLIELYTKTGQIDKANEARDKLEQLLSPDQGPISPDTATSVQKLLKPMAYVTYPQDSIKSLADKKYAEDTDAIKRSKSPTLTDVDAKVNNFTLGGSKIKITGADRIEQYSDNLIYASSKDSIVLQAPNIYLMGKVTNITSASQTSGVMNASYEMPEGSTSPFTGSGSPFFGGMGPEVSGGSNYGPSYSPGIGGRSPGNYKGTTTGSSAGSNARAQQAFQFFKSKGWSDTQAASIVGNLMQESSLNPQIQGDFGAAFGIGQWHPDRQANFEKVFGHPIQQSTYEEQLQFVQWEFDNTHKSAANALRQTSSVEEGAAVVSGQYEVAGTPMLGNRIAYGNSVLQSANAIANAPAKLIGHSPNINTSSYAVPNDQASTSGTPTANFMRGQFGAPGQNLTTVTLKDGQQIKVNAESADAFKGFYDDLIDQGVPIGKVTGYSYRNIAGSSTLSQHSFGNATDFGSQWGRDQINHATRRWIEDHPDAWNATVAKWGMVDGGKFKSGGADLGHVEWGGVKPFLVAPKPSTPKTAWQNEVLDSMHHDTNSAVASTPTVVVNQPVIAPPKPKVPNTHDGVNMSASSLPIYAASITA